MSDLEAVRKVAVVVVGAAASYLFGGLSALLQVLLGFVAADYLTGMIAAGIEGKLSSSVGLRGIAKKVFIFVIIAVAHLADRAMGGENLLKDATCFFYIGNELLSIIENAGRSGVPVPTVLKRAVDILRTKGEAK